MRINGLTVCVNYSDFLENSISLWMGGLDSLTIVTDTKDLDTDSLVANCQLMGLPCRVRLHQTDVFYAKGAKFNKGAAMEEARLHMPWEDWILFFDADIIPPIGWRSDIERNALTLGLRLDTLYGATRYQATTNGAKGHKINDAPCDGGYFHLFHSSTIPSRDVPLLETCWSHAGVYDSKFKERWHPSKRGVLPLDVLHLGEQENWCGIGKKTEMEALKEERRRKGGYLHEKLPE